MLKIHCTIVFLLFSTFLTAQQQLPVETINPKLLNQEWVAEWITHPTARTTDYGVYHFRKSFRLKKVEKEFVIHVSGDNRYRLYVNGKYVCNGPSRGDLNNWRFETIDIAPFLQHGENAIAAVVWNFGKHRPVAQISLQTAFLLQANDEKNAFVNTSSQWKVKQNKAYTPITDAQKRLQAYIVVGPGMEFNSNYDLHDWENANYPDIDWEKPRSLGNAMPKGNDNTHFWQLVPRTIPMLAEKQQRFAKTKWAENIGQVKAEFLRGSKQANIFIPTYTTAKILLDQSQLTTAYPHLIVSKGKNSRIQLEYGESLFYGDGKTKGNRNETMGKNIKGFRDVFFPDGEKNRHFSTLWFRTWRYIEITIETKDQSLIINDIYSIFRAYPFQQNATFKSNDHALQKIWQVGWHTARLCAGETYYDSPYYEQLQYIGDTRIQSLISLYVSGDDKLMRKAIGTFEASKLKEGLTQSRYPSRESQIIPPYALLWINMVHDYWMHRKDDEFVEAKLKMVTSILDWYIGQINHRTGLIGETPHWNFVDWAKEWPKNNETGYGGVPNVKGGSAILSLQLAYSMQAAVDLLRNYDRTIRLNFYQDIINRLKSNVMLKCWDEDKNLVADTPAKASFSQHANVLAALVDAIPESKQDKVLFEIVNNKDLIQTTFYFKFYLFEALQKAGFGSNYLQLIQPWHDMIQEGLTTFAETPKPTRSDCHAWSASPNYHFLSLVCGVKPAKPGFEMVQIAPNLGTLDWASGTIPHPKGAIKVHLKRKGKKGIQAQITLPTGMKGAFSWNGKTIALKGGYQKFKVK